MQKLISILCFFALAPVNLGKAVAAESKESSPPTEAAQPSNTKQPTTGISYKSVDEAVESLRTKPGAITREENDWVVVNDSSENTFWSITQKNNPAYPAIVRRILVEANGAIHIKMTVDCWASKEACDEMVQAFKDLNAKAQAAMQKQGTE